MLKADAQTKRAVFFPAVAAALGVGVSVALGRDARAGGDLAVLGSLASVGGFLVALVVPRLGATLGSLVFVGLALNTYPIGGLAFLMPAFVCALALLTPFDWLPHVVGVVGILGVLLGSVSVGGEGILAMPVMLPMLGWASVRSHGFTRHLYGVFGALVAAGGFALLAGAIGAQALVLAILGAVGFYGTVTSLIPTRLSRERLTS